MGRKDPKDLANGAEVRKKGFPNSWSLHGGAENPSPAPCKPNISAPILHQSTRKNRAGLLTILGVPSGRRRICTVDGGVLIFDMGLFVQD
jgi:hypothetical protein